MDDFAGSADAIAEKLVAGGMDPQQAMMMALRMAQSRQQADQSILGGVPTQPPTSDVPPATEILGGDPSKLFQRQPTTMERIKDLPKDVLGAGEALVSMGSLAALAPASMLYALRPGQKTQGDPMEFALRNMYMPRSERGPSHLAGLGEVLESLPQTGPLPELQAFTGVGRGVGRQLAEKGRQAGRAMAPAAANVAEDILRRQGLLMDVVKPKGGQFIGGDVPENIDRQLKRLKSRYDPEVALEDVRQMRQQFGDLPRYAEAERTITNQKAVDQWIDRNLSNYVKKEMGTPEDPVRKLAESGVTHIQERYDEPGLTTVIKRKEAGFPEQGIGQSPEARSWENLSDRSIDDYLAGTVQPQAGYVKDFERLNKELSDFGRQITKRFFNERTERLVRQGETPENAQQIISDFIVNRSPGELARELNDSDLLKQYSTLRARTNYARSLLDQEYANILRENPWVEKLDPNTRLYTARTENLQFDHIVDVLRDDLDSGRIRPEQLSKVSMADAVRRTYEFDQEMAKKAEQAQAELANKLLNESPFKVYDNGYKWVKLPDPASSDEAMKLVQDIGCQGGWCTQKETNALYYGAHGEGNNLFVLMSPDKRVHAQIHVQSPEKPYDFDALMSDPQTKAQAAQAVREWRQRNPNVETPLADDQIYQALREAGIPEQSPAISEIKPRANSWTSQMVADQVAKDPEYKNTIRSMLSDFVQTTKYPVEWDLENAGLVAIDRAGDLAKAMQAAKEEVPRYVTNEELSKLLQKYLPQRYKQGGSVNHKAVASARRALEKAMAKGGQVKMAGGGSVIGKAAAAAAKQAKAVLSPAESQANLQKMLAESQIKSRLYHGTKAHDDYADQPGQAFEQFTGRPTWLAQEPYTASGYSGGTGSTYPVFAQVKNPLNLGFDANDDANKAFATAKRLGVDVDHIRRMEKPEKAWQVINHPAFIDAVEKAGYDGLVINEGGYKTFGVLDPRKIKSAIGNRGTYDITSPELSKAYGGEVKMGTGGSMLGTVAGKAAAAGKKSTQWAQEAAAAKRAPAKSKEEIEAIARRMAAQTQPGFVRASEEQSINPAGKSQLLYEMEQRTPMVVESTIADRPVPNVDYEQQLGKVIVGVPGDPTMGQVAVPGSLDAPTRGGKQLVQVGDVRPETPVQLYGGPRYGANLDETFWASNLSPARAVQNLVQEMAQKYGAEQVLGKYIKMSPESSRFAMHNLDALISVLQPEKLDKDKVELLNNLVRKGNPKHKFPEFAGFEDPVNVLLQAQMNSKLRKQISEVLEKPSVAKQVGFPFPGKVVQTAITEPELRNVETGVTGFAMGKMNPEGKLSFSSHPTYDYDIPGQAIGRSKYLIPSEMSFPDFTAWYRSRPDVQAKVDPINMMKSYGPRQVIDQQYIDEIKMYEEAMKRLTGRKKGGLAKMAGGGSVLGKAAKAASKASKAGRNMEDYLKFQSSVELIEPKRLYPPHDVENKEKFESLVKSMKEEGWVGRPILYYDIGRGPEALTGSHRIAAAKKAGLDEIPVVKVSGNIGDYVDEFGNSINELSTFNADEMSKWLRKYGDDTASQLMKLENLRQKQSEEKKSIGGLAALRK